MKEKYIFQEESYKIIGACLEVHKELGCGFLEAVYQEALEEDHISQVLNYLNTNNYKLGLLFNFGEKSLKYKRVIL